MDNGRLPTPLQGTPVIQAHPFGERRFSSPAQPLRRTVGSPAPFRLAGRGQIMEHGKIQRTCKSQWNPPSYSYDQSAPGAPGPGARPSFPPSLICPRTAPGPIAKTLRLCGDPGPALHVRHHPASVWLWPRLWFRLRPRHRHRCRIQCGHTKPADFVLPPPLDPHHRYLRISVARLVPVLQA